MAEGEKPLRKIVEAFEGLAESVKSKIMPMEVAALSHACSHLPFLIGCLGIAFKFGEMHYISKVDDLSEASKSISTLESLLDLDIEHNCVRKGIGHTLTVLRVKRGIDTVRVLFEEILATEGNSIKDAASVAYEKALAPYHGWPIRKAVATGIMYALPTKAQLLKKINEDGLS